MIETTKRIKKPWYKMWWIWVVALALIIFGSINAANSDTPDETPAAGAPAEQPAEEPTAEEPEPTMPDTTSDELNTALLAAFGADSYQNLTPDMWAYYIVEVEAVNNGLARITMQVDGDDPIAEGSSRAAFSLIGQQFPDLLFMEIVDGAGVHIEQTSRRDVPLLNQ